MRKEKEEKAMPGTASWYFLCNREIVVTPKHMTVHPPSPPPNVCVTSLSGFSPNTRVKPTHTQ